MPKPELDLDPKHLRRVLELLALHAPEAEVWAYGSRVSGSARAASDLDLVLRNPQRLDAPQKNIHRLRAALRESDLPIVVEVLDWALIPESFRREIARRHVLLTRPQPTARP